MRTLIYLCVFFVSFSSIAQSTKKEKKAISTLVKKIKNIDNVEKKEKAIGKVLNKMNENYQEINREELSSTEQEELDILFDNLNNGFAAVQGRNHEDLDAFIDFMESEFNQASAITTVLIMVGIIGLLYLLHYLIEGW